MWEILKQIYGFASNTWISLCECNSSCLHPRLKQLQNACTTHQKDNWQASKNIIAGSSEFPMTNLFNLISRTDVQCDQKPWNLEATLIDLYSTKFQNASSSPAKEQSFESYFFFQEHVNEKLALRNTIATVGLDESSNFSHLSKCLWEPCKHRSLL